MYSLVFPEMTVVPAAIDTDLATIGGEFNLYEPRFIDWFHLLSPNGSNRHKSFHNGVGLRLCLMDFGTNQDALQCRAIEL